MVTDQLPARQCVWCYRPLPTTPATNTGTGLQPDTWFTVTCACGLVYSTELIAESDPNVWDAVVRRDGYEVHRDPPDSPTATVTDLRAAERWLGNRE